MPSICALSATFKELRILVPGPWRGRAHFIQCLLGAEPSGRFALTDGRLCDVIEPATAAPVWVELQPRNDGLIELFEQADEGDLSSAARLSLHAHQSVVSMRVNIDLARDGARLLRFTRLLRGAGGLAIHVETCGIAHGWERWFSLVANTLHDIYQAVVTVAHDGARLQSCGMHHFGLPDCTIRSLLPPAKQIELIHQFNWRQLTEREPFVSGREFSVGGSAPRYRLSRASDVLHAPDTPAFNPNGFWLLRELAMSMHEGWGHLVAPSFLRLPETNSTPLH